MSFKNGLIFIFIVLLIVSFAIGVGVGKGKQEKKISNIQIDGYGKLKIWK